MLISHPATKNAVAKPLTEHLLNVGERSRQAVRGMRLDLTVITQERLEQLSFLVGIFHDIGKATTYFQNYIKKKERKSKMTRHSLISAVVAYYFVKSQMGNPLWGYAAFMVIKRHHGQLEAFDLSDYETTGLKDDIKNAGRQLKNILENAYEPLENFYTQYIAEFEVLRDIDLAEIEDLMEDSDDLIYDDLDELLDNHCAEKPEDNERRIEFFYIVELLFSLLIDYDKKDAARLGTGTGYYEGNLEEPANDVFAYIEHLRELHPEKFDKQKPINRLRDEFLKEIVSNPNITADNHFYTVTAPTGIGKTFGCLAFANKLMETLPGQRARIVYCLPYTSIIDQNYQQFEEVVRFNKGAAYDRRPGRYLLKHHYLTPKKPRNRVDEDHYTYQDYLDDNLLVESWEASFIVTTFVQFFHTVIGNRNRYLKKFHNIVNSIVILDEIQNVDPTYYRLLSEVLNVLGKRFNIYFLLTTATQPQIFHREKSAPVALVESSRYMAHRQFNRVKLHVEDRVRTLQDFKNEFCATFSGDNCLLVMNTKKAAVSLYTAIRDNKPGYRVYSLTTNMVPNHRRRKIEEIKTALKAGQRIIVVATQLIEAGVDISFRTVYRDMGPLDSIIQVAGRCNRNGEYGELGGDMHLLRLANENHQEKEFATYIYKSIILQMVEKTFAFAGEAAAPDADPEYQAKEFEELSATYFKQFDFQAESSAILEAIYHLNYDREMQKQIPVKDFRLIKEYAEESLYILTTQQAQQDMERLLLCRETLCLGEMSEDETDGLRLDVERLKVSLKGFSISVFNRDLEPYENIINGDDYLRYIGFDDQEQYAYDEELGFLREPKEDISRSVIF
ncbi:MAG: CRISPR-associated helicase Cas3' [bacterium]|nr:CRISPR-associated helicase Cas3' [bacterium]